MVGHVLQQAGYERIMQVVYSFHMPMLFILSGYFISDKKSFREFAVSRAVRLLIPYIKCCIVLIIGKSLIAALLGKDIVFALIKWLYISFYGSGNGQGTWGFDNSGSWHKVFNEEIGMMWFLLALFFGGLIVKWFCGKKYAICGILFCSFVGIFSSKVINLPFSFQNGLGVTFWIFLGVWLKTKNLICMVKQINNYHIFLCILLWGGSSLFGETQLFRNYYGLGIFDILGALGASVSIFLVAEWLGKRRKNTIICRILQWAGYNTMMVYCLHFVTWNLFITSILRRFVHGSLATVLACIAVTGMCMLGTYYLERFSSKFCCIKCRKGY